LAGPFCHLPIIVSLGFRPGFLELFREGACREDSCVVGINAPFYNLSYFLEYIPVGVWARAFHVHSPEQERQQSHVLHCGLLHREL
jgi:hypothetical protein